MAIDNNIESLDGPFATEKNQFYYPEGDKRILVRPNRLYMVYYTKDKNITFVDSIYGNFIFPVFNKSPFLSYVNAKPGISREIYLKSSKVIITQKDRKKGIVIRYFAKYSLDKYDKIFEIKKQDFGIETNLYNKVSIRWQLKGSKENILMKNKNSLELAENSLQGMQNFLDPLEFYEEEITSYEEIQEKLGRLKFPPESTDTSSNQPPLPPPDGGGGSY